MMLTQVLWAQGKSEQALRSCEQAFADYPRGDIDWFLIRGTLQRELGRHDERINGFQEGYQLTGSIVLRIAEVEACIEADRGREVLPYIEEQLEASRLKSSWLLRRGRALLSLDDADHAKSDFEAAIKELDRRIHPQRPDVSLVRDRGLARALLGDFEGARADRKFARSNGASKLMLTLLDEALLSEERETSVSANP